ncbi:MAG: phosphate ABC transporter permease PstA [Cyanothece sp. SIO1E1]|nr:phosphate ABC transporter permease PstA [Cyanothece sp. SIO1E1]
MTLSSEPIASSRSRLIPRSESVVGPFDVRVLEKAPFSQPALVDIGLTTMMTACVVVTLIPLFAVLTYVLLQGMSRLDLALLTQLPAPPGSAGGGLANAILGTLIVVGIAVLISVPFGVSTALYLSEFSQGNQLARWIRFATKMLSGIPSIIAGVFAYGLLVRTGLTGYSAIAGGVGLTVLMLPTIVLATDEALQLVPQELRWAAFGVGASRSQTVLRIVMPAAMPSIVTGVMLAIARAAGETAPLIFTALSSSFWPNGLFEPIATLSVLVFNFSTFPFAPQQALAWAGSLILVLLVLITSIAARLATRRRVY